MSQPLFSGDPLLVTMDMQTGATVFQSFIHTPTNICTSAAFKYRPGLCWIWLNLELFYTFLWHIGFGWSFYLFEQMQHFITCHWIFILPFMMVTTRNLIVSHQREAYKAAWEFQEICFSAPLPWTLGGAQSIRLHGDLEQVGQFHTVQQQRNLRCRRIYTSYSSVALKPNCTWFDTNWLIKESFFRLQ